MKNKFHKKIDFNLLGHEIRKRSNNIDSIASLLKIYMDGQENTDELEQIIDILQYNATELGIIANSLDQNQN